MFLYIHGFRSVGLCHKGSILKSFAPTSLLPDLPYSPKLAIEFLQKLILENKDKKLCLIGSSLGGFYATYLAEKFQCKAVLINPLVYAYEMLYPAIGKIDVVKKNESFLWSLDLVNELNAFKVKKINSSLYFVLLQKGDSVLDYKIAKDFYKDSKMCIEEGGSHYFDDFLSKKDMILDFANS